MTTEVFVERLQKLYGNAYDYSDIVYVKSNIKTDIICKKHGKFSVRPNDILRGHGCPKCANEARKEKLACTKESFLLKAREVHGWKYDYSKVEYNGNDIKVCIICPEHGEFWQTPHSHLNGRGCPICGKEKRIAKRTDTSENFISRARKVHGDKYDYSRVVYKNSMEKVCIICPTHGEFWQRPVDHLHNHGCAKCSGVGKFSTEEFIKVSNAVHNGYYDYSRVNYVNNRKKVCIICPEHGEFWQQPSHHMNGHGCPKCYKSKLESDIIELLENNSVKYEYNHRYSFLDNLQLDFYIPELKIAIECQGVQHFAPVKAWGGKEKLEMSKHNDKKKYLLCEKEGIRLLYYSNLTINYPYEVITDKEEILRIIENERNSKKI